MGRTQLYLTRDERCALQALSRRTGRPQSELIREAINALLLRADQQERRRKMPETRGLWSDRDDLPDFDEPRGAADRNSDAA